jgi:hypothetical protein
MLGRMQFVLTQTTLVVFGTTPTAEKLVCLMRLRVKRRVQGIL